MKRFFSLVALLMLVLTVAACGGGDKATPAPTDATAVAAPTTAAEPAAASAATSQPAADTPTAEAATPVAANTPAADDAANTDIKTLDILDSYRAVVSYSAKGTDIDGKSVDSSSDMTTSFVKDPLARHISGTFTDASDPANVSEQTMEIYQVGQDAYAYSDEETGWTHMSTDEEDPFGVASLIFDAKSMFGDLSKLKRVRPDEEINGIESRHYRFDETMLTDLFKADIGSVKSATGDVWVAQDGEYVTKYDMTIEVADDTSGNVDGDIANGKVHATLELQDVNEKIEITVPEEALAGGSMPGFDGAAFPLPEETKIDVGGVNFMMANSPMSVEEVVAFYEETLTGMGWTKDEENSAVMEGMATLAYTKDETQLSVMVMTNQETNQTQIIANAE